MPESCSIEGCEKPVRSRGWCASHYAHWWKYGTPHRRPEYEVCQVDDCSRSPRSRTSDLCDVHYCRRWRTGTLERSTNHKKRPSYRAAHSRVARAKGKAAEHSCVDCGLYAKHWSFAWQGVSADTWLWESFNGTWLAYTGSPDDYEPRCRRCARRYDSAFAMQGWRHAHHGQVTRQSQLAG